MSTSAAEHLAAYGVTVDQAYAFIVANLPTPQVIYDVALAYGVTSAMLGEITGYSAEAVEGFFTSLGMDGEALRGEQGPGEGLAFVSTLLAPVAHLYALNTETGELSNASIRASIRGSFSSDEAYNAVFDPAAYAGGADGTFSTADLGFEHLGELAADQATLESLFFGTVISMMRRVSTAEDTAISNATDPELPAVVVDAYLDAAEGERRIPDNNMPTICNYISAFLVKNGTIDNLFDGLISYWY